MMIKIPISLGELIDKISILRIKKKNIQNIKNKKFVNSELLLLEKILKNILNKNTNIKKYLNKLIIINTQLWKIEDNLRECERKKIFDDEFINLARSVYFTNDERSKTKNEINKKFASQIVEIKSYKKY
jgi:hypothetical protein